MTYTLTHEEPTSSMPSLAQLDCWEAAEALGRLIRYGDLPEASVRYAPEADWTVEATLTARSQDDIDLALETLGLTTVTPHDEGDGRRIWSHLSVMLTVTYPRGSRAWR